MTSISILGTGNMGSAIQAVAERGGHPVQLLGTEDRATPVTGDVVVLAVPTRPSTRSSPPAPTSSPARSSST